MNKTMTMKHKKSGTKKKDPNDFTLIQLRKTTVAKLKDRQYRHFKATGESLVYDSIIQNLLGRI